MPLPNLVPPSSVPAFLVFGHDFQYESPFGHVPMGTGHDRKRRTVTRRPVIANAALIMELPAAEDWAAWVRDSLRNGERPFSARVAQQGGAPVWYEIQLVSMYQWTGMHKGRKRADMQLRLIGDASATGPALGVFSSRAGLDVTGSARLTVIRNMSSRAGLEVT